MGIYENKKKRDEIMKVKGNLTEGNPLTCILKYLIPLMLGNLFQQFYNIADSIVVGRLIGADALAAVGATGTLVALFIMVATGTGIGASVILAQLFGAGQYQRLKTAISTEIITVAGISLVLSLIGSLTGSTLLRLLHTPANILAGAQDYLTIYFYGFIFLFMYNVFASIFNGLGDSEVPLFFLLFSSILNIVLDIVLIRVCKMGISGAAWATVIAQGVAAVLSALVLVKRVYSFCPEKCSRYDTNLLKQMARVAIPTILQQSVISIGGLLIQSCVNQFGSVFLAGYTAATRIDNIAILPMVNCGNAVSTFVAQNLGAGKVDRAKKGCSTGICIAAIFAIILGVVLHFFSKSCMLWFMDPAEAAASIDCGVHYLKFVSMFYFFMGIMKIYAGMLRGAGDMKWFLGSTIVNLVVRTLLTYALAGTIGESSIAVGVACGWILADALVLFRYYQGTWQKIKLI